MSPLGLRSFSLSPLGFRRSFSLSPLGFRKNKSM